LLLKHLHKFYSRESLPWVDLVWFKYYQNKVPHATRELGSFWWKDILRLNGIYRGFSQCDIGDGVSTCFWEDRWSESLLATSFARLASFALNSAASVKEVLDAEDLDAVFFLPLSQEAFQEQEQLQETLPHTPSILVLEVVLGLGRNCTKENVLNSRGENERNYPCVSVISSAAFNRALLRFLFRAVVLFSVGHSVLPNYSSIEAFVALPLQHPGH
jgi:hypothetical protein